MNEQEMLKYSENISTSLTFTAKQLLNLRDVFKLLMSHQRTFYTETELHPDYVELLWPIENFLCEIGLLKSTDRMT